MTVYSYSVITIQHTSVSPVTSFWLSCCTWGHLWPLQELYCHLLVTLPHSLTQNGRAWVLWLLLWIRSVPPSWFLLFKPIHTPIFPPWPYFPQKFPMHMQLEQQNFYDAVQSIVTRHGHSAVILYTTQPISAPPICAANGAVPRSSSNIKHKYGLV